MSALFIPICADSEAVGMVIKMKLFGITAGRRGGNSETLMKHALMTARDEFEADISWVNLHQAKILPCNGCTSCTRRVVLKHEPPRCVYQDQDDVAFIMRQVTQADGLVVAVPSFCMQPQGLWRIFTDRWMPYEWGLQLQAGVVDCVPQRVAGLITVGGSTQNWMTMSLAGLNVSMFMQSIKVVDMMMATRCAGPGHVLAYSNFMEQAAELGRNVARSCQKDYREVTYLGREPGWCPICHHNLMLKGKPHWDGVSYPYECALCGAGGDFRLDKDGNLEFVLADNGLEHCRIFTEGRANHEQEIAENQKNYAAVREQIQAAAAAYRTLDSCQLQLPTE